VRARKRVSWFFPLEEEKRLRLGLAMRRSGDGDVIYLGAERRLAASDCLRDAVIVGGIFGVNLESVGGEARAVRG
jgi:hypothetical protein